MKLKVTEKNMANVMGRINKFLSKPTRRYAGKRQFAVGEERRYIPVYEERDVYEPFIGQCTEHYLRTEVRQKSVEERDLDDTLRLHSCLLSLSNNYEPNCIPIMAGFTVDITGDRMVIKENDIYHYTAGFGGKISKYKMKEKSSYEYFYHMPISDEEKKDCQVHAMRCGVDYLFETQYCGSFHDFLESDYLVSEAMDTSRDIQEMFDDLIDSVDDELITELTDSREINGKVVEVYCNAGAFKDGIPETADSVYITVDGERYYDVVMAVLNILEYDDSEADWESEDD